MMDRLEADWNLADELFPAATQIVDLYRPMDSCYPVCCHTRT